MAKTAKVSALASCYRAERFLPAFLENCAAQTIADTAEIVLVHNDPTPEELTLVGDFTEQYPGLITHIVTEREGFARSMNRAVQAAAGEYLCVWNVDDLRTPQSLEKMADLLDQFPSVGFTYGDYRIVERWRATKGVDVVPPAVYDAREFVRGMHLGPFFMWRRLGNEDIGGWDEQFAVASDFDFAIRLALSGEGRKADGLLGYYLNDWSGLSTSPSGPQPTEATAIMIRYGTYSRVDLSRVHEARQFDVNDLHVGDVRVPVDSLLLNRFRFQEPRACWILAIPWTLKAMAIRLVVRTSLAWRRRGGREL